jgi:hypothetical protein
MIDHTRQCSLLRSTNERHSCVRVAHQRQRRWGQRRRRRRRASKQATSAMLTRWTPIRRTRTELEQEGSLQLHSHLNGRGQEDTSCILRADERGSLTRSPFSVKRDDETTISLRSLGGATTRTRCCCKKGRVAGPSVEPRSQAPQSPSRSSMERPCRRVVRLIRRGSLYFPRNRITSTPRSQ